MTSTTPEPESATGIEARVAADIARRQAVGQRKYGQTLEEAKLNLQSFAQHLYEELLDAAIYCKGMMETLERDLGTAPIVRGRPPKPCQKCGMVARKRNNRCVYCGWIQEKPIVASVATTDPGAMGPELVQHPEPIIGPVSGSGTYNKTPTTEIP